MVTIGEIHVHLVPDAMAIDPPDVDSVDPAQSARLERSSRAHHL
jgi:hypothetical protein